MATGQNIVDEVRIQLNDGDVANLRWPDSEMLLYVNAAQRQIVTLLPEANVVREVVAIAADSTSRQELPANGVKFIDVQNYNGESSVPGPVITAVEKDALDASFPMWPYETTHATEINNPNNQDEYSFIRFHHFHHDPRQPKVYFLYPPSDSGSAFQVLLTYSKLPDALAALGDTFGLNDEYQNAAVDYVIYRCLMKDGRYSANVDRRQEMWNTFRTTLGLKPEVERRVDPGTIRPPMDDHG